MYEYIREKDTMREAGTIKSRKCGQCGRMLSMTAIETKEHAAKCGEQVRHKPTTYGATDRINRPMKHEDEV